jgi:predicted DNA binding CopG/RHH family protein
MMAKYKVIDEPFDDEEQYLMKQVEDGNMSDMSKKREAEIRKTVLSKNISIRLNQADLDAIREKAVNAGLPYQTLINAVIHRYVNGDIVIKTPI